MKASWCLALFGLVCLPSVYAQEDAMSHLFRQNVYTPIPDHRTDIVPGMLVIVNYTAGTYEIADVEDDARAFELEKAYTGQLNKRTVVKIKGGGLATSGLKVLIGFDPHFAIKSDNTFDFSGVHFNMVKLRSQRIHELIERSGDTQKAAMAAYLSGGSDVFIVTDVGSTDSVTVKSNTMFTLAAGTATVDLKDCTAAPPTQHAGGTPPTQSGAGGAATTPPTETVDTLQSKEKVVGEKAKADGAASGSELGGSLYYCKGVDNSVVFTNPTPVPTVMKLKRIIFPSPTDPPVLINGDFAVPLNDINLCKRHFEKNDGCYDVPRQ